jgi:hypothetical protein
LVVCIFNVFAPTSIVDAAAPVRFNAPAEATDNVPDEVVDKLNGPDATVIDNPPVLGPVIVLAVVPEKVTLPPSVNRPVPAVIAPFPNWTCPLFTVWIFSVLAPTSIVDAAAPVILTAPAEFRLIVLVPVAPVVDKVKGPVALVSVNPFDPGPVIVAPDALLNVKLPPNVTSPVPVVIAPLLEVCIFKVLAPTSIVEAADPVKFKAPAEATEIVPEVVVDKLKGPVATVSVKPPDVGPVIVLAAVPEKVTLPPSVNNPVPVVIAPLPI